jgi:hypothetical protein
MSSLRQPSRSPPGPLGWSRRNTKAQQFVKRPASIGEFRSLGRSSFDPSPPIAALTVEPERAVRLAEVVYGAHQPHPRLKRHPPTCRRARFARKRDEPGAERGLKPLDVGGVDHRASTALRRARASPHRPLRTADDAPDHPGHSSPSVSLGRSGDHEALRQKESGVPSLAGAKRLVKHLQRLLGVARKPIGAKQKALECSTCAHAKQLPDQGALAPYLHHAPQPALTTRAHRPGQPKHPSHNPHAQLIGLNLPLAHLSL